MPVQKTNIVTTNRRIKSRATQNYVAPAVSTRVHKPIVTERLKMDRSNNIAINAISVGDCAKNSVKGSLAYMWFNMPFRTYQVEENKGINLSRARKVDVCLAKYAKGVAEEMETGGACYTGTKWAFLNAGVLNDYDDMPRGCAKDSISYFDSNTEKFEKVEVKKEDLNKLPAGRIIVYTKDGKAGHIAVTNGFAQEMSDCTDNMKWLDAQGENAEFVVYKLTDNWSYDEETRKLKFTKPQT